MLSDIKDLSITALPKTPGAAQVNVTVTVTAANSPTDPPVFSYLGLDTQRSIWINNETADFTLTLNPVGFPSDFQVTFAPLAAGEAGPITWRSPGQKKPVPRPDYITDPVLSDDAMTLTFTVTNTATPGKDVLVSFTVSVLVTEPGTPGQIFESPDPTIINVDPPPVLPVC